jgi:hypothetical protein
MRAHTITTKASTIVPGGILALGLAVVLMGATASTASAERYIGTWNCPPLPQPPPASWPVDDPQIQGCLGSLWITPPDWPEGDTLGSFDFGHHQLGTSASQRIAVGVVGDTFSPKISVSGIDVQTNEYAQTNNCPPTLSAPEGRVKGCLIDVTFTPTGKGPRPLGILTTGPGGPTMGLSGAGPAPTDPPNLKLSGKKKQSLGQGGFPTSACIEHGRCPPNVQVKVSCGDVQCTGPAKGKLTKVKKDKLKPAGRGLGSTPVDLEAGETETVALKPTKKAHKQVREALAEGKKVKAKLTVRAKDAAGNVAVAKRTIRLVK